METMLREQQKHLDRLMIEQQARIPSTQEQAARGEGGPGREGLELMGKEQTFI